jgi:hypothetical protein
VYDQDDRERPCRSAVTAEHRILLWPAPGSRPRGGNLSRPNPTINHLVD